MKSPPSHAQLARSRTPLPKTTQPLSNTVWNSTVTSADTKVVMLTEKQCQLAIDALRYQSLCLEQIQTRMAILSHVKVWQETINDIQSLIPVFQSEQNAPVIAPAVETTVRHETPLPIVDSAEDVASPTTDALAQPATVDESWSSWGDDEWVRDNAVAPTMSTDAVASIAPIYDAQPTYVEEPAPVHETATYDQTTNAHVQETQAQGYDTTPAYDPSSYANNASVYDPQYNNASTGYETQTNTYETHNPVYDSQNTAYEAPNITYESQNTAYQSQNTSYNQSSYDASIYPSSAPLTTDTQVADAFTSLSQVNQQVNNAYYDGSNYANTTTTVDAYPAMDQTSDATTYRTPAETSAPQFLTNIVPSTTVGTPTPSSAYYSTPLQAPTFGQVQVSDNTASLFGSVKTPSWGQAKLSTTPLPLSPAPVAASVRSPSPAISDKPIPFAPYKPPVVTPYVKPVAQTTEKTVDTKTTPVANTSAYQYNQTYPNTTQGYYNNYYDSGYGYDYANQTSAYPSPPAMTPRAPSSMSLTSTTSNPVENPNTSGKGYCDMPKVNSSYTLKSSSIMKKKKHVCMPVSMGGFGSDQQYYGNRETSLAVTQSATPSVAAPAYGNYYSNSGYDPHYYNQQYHGQTNTYNGYC